MRDDEDEPTETRHRPAASEPPPFEGAPLLDEVPQEELDVLVALDDTPTPAPAVAADESSPRMQRSTNMELRAIQQQQLDALAPTRR